MDTWDILKTWAERDDRIMLYRQQDQYWGGREILFLFSKELRPSISCGTLMMIGWLQTISRN